jgi:hypothetical protein
VKKLLKSLTLLKMTSKAFEDHFFEAVEAADNIVVAEKLEVFAHNQPKSLDLEGEKHLVAGLEVRNPRVKEGQNLPEASEKLAEEVEKSAKEEVEAVYNSAEVELCNKAVNYLLEVPDFGLEFLS